jgi:putative hydrolase
LPKEAFALKLLFDIHTHTTASGHAFSTLKENIEEAKAKGLLAFGTSDHAPAMPGAPGPIFFKNYKAIPKEIMGLAIYTGVEANILDFQGRLDLEDEMLARMDYVIASLHIPCIKAGTRAENTDALIGAMQNPYVKIIGHPDDDRYPLDYPKLVEAAARYKVALEVNSSSTSPRTGRKNADKNIPAYLELCKEYRIPVIVSSDAHIWSQVGNFATAEAMLNAVNFPEELILNTRLSGLDYVLNQSERLREL